VGAQGPSSQVDLSKIPSDLITKNESSEETPEIEYAPVPDKFTPLFDNSGPIEFRVYCDISNQYETVKCPGTVNNDKIVGTSKSDDIVVRTAIYQQWTRKHNFS
jgi:hypothetical protein